MIVKARFDGRVFVPEEPVSLTEGQAVTLTVESAAAVTEAGPTPLLELIDRLDRLPCAADWPEDASVQHDHYLYGLPKRP